MFFFAILSIEISRKEVDIMSGLGGIFNVDSKFSVFMSRVFDLIVLNVIACVCSIPLFTVGANLTALYYVTLKMAKNEESYIIRAYFKSWKENFKQATIIWLFSAVLGIVLLVDLIMSNRMGGTVSTVMKYIFMVIMVLFLFFFTYVFPVLAQFYNTTKNTMRNAILMSITHLPYTILMLLVTFGPFILAILIPEVFVWYTLYALLGGLSVPALVNSYMFKKIFAKYMPKEEEEEITADEDFSIEEQMGTAAALEARDAETTADETDEISVMEESSENNSEEKPQ